MNKGIVFSLIFVSFGSLCASSAIDQIWADIKLQHEKLAKVNAKLQSGDISVKKSEEKKYPIWKKLAQDYSNLSSAYYYSSKSSVGVDITAPNTFSNISVIVPNVPDIRLSAQDVALINAALLKSVLDVRVFFDAAKKMLFYTVVDVATNLSVTSGSVAVSLQVAPQQWYIVGWVKNKQTPTSWQTFDNSIYLQIS